MPPPLETPPPDEVWLPDEAPPPDELPPPDEAGCLAGVEATVCAGVLGLTGVTGCAVTIGWTGCTGTLGRTGVTGCVTVAVDVATVDDGRVARFGAAFIGGTAAPGRSAVTGT